jgi:amidase
LCSFPSFTADTLAQANPWQHLGDVYWNTGWVLISSSRSSTLRWPTRTQPGGMFAVGDMHASMGDGEICGTGVEIGGEVVARFDVLKGKQAVWPVTELSDAWLTHGTSDGDFHEAMQAATEEAAKLLVDQWGFSMEEAFVFLSVACDVGICQACRPSPFSAIARVSIPKLSATPAPFR